MSEVSDAWWNLAFRQLEMAQCLLPKFPDGSFFHIYHAFECGCSAAAILLAKDQPLPHLHTEKINNLTELLDSYDQSLKQQALALQIRLDHRNESLYVGWKGHKIREPHTLFTLPQLNRTIRHLHSFLKRLQKVAENPPPSPLARA